MLRIEIPAAIAPQSDIPTQPKPNPKDARLGWSDISEAPLVLDEGGLSLRGVALHQIHTGKLMGYTPIPGE